MKFLEIEILLLFIQFFYTNEIRQKFQNNYLNKSTLIPNKTAVPLNSTTNNNKYPANLLKISDITIPTYVAILNKRIANRIPSMLVSFTTSSFKTLTPSK